MTAIEQIERQVLSLTLEQRVHLAESLLASLTDLEESAGEELAEAERRECEISDGKVTPLSEHEFWQRMGSLARGQD